MQAKNILQVFQVLAEDNPQPTTELKYNSTFELLIAVVLSAQATDISVNKATARLFIIANTPKQFLALGVEGLEGYIKSIGLYKTKARNIIGLCQKLITEYGEQVPNDYSSLISLPGVGRKTANVVLNTAFFVPTIAVDTHIFRVSRRLGLSLGENVLQVEKDLNRVVPQQYKQNAHHWLILHGRYVCKARKPLCSECKLNAYCAYFRENDTK